jgi:hypothetical protein
MTDAGRSPLGPAAVAAELDRRGVVHLPGFVDRDTAAAVADHAWTLLGRRGVHRDDPRSWPVGRPAKLQFLARADVYRPFTGPALDALADAVLGSGRWVELNRPTPLLSFPEPGPWTVPTAGWHIDLPARGPAAPPVALRVLGLVEAVAPGGGGTVAVEGSHELIRRLVAEREGDAGSSAAARSALCNRHEWFRELTRPGGDRGRYLGPVEVDGVTVRVVELTGEPGDAFLLHPWTLHAQAANAAAAVRSMFTHTLYGA